MSELKAGPGSMDEPKLPRRDWILLPLLSVLTIGLLVVSTELMARRLFGVSTSSLKNCAITDNVTGVRVIPNTVCWMKASEDPSTVEYRFNSCGERAGAGEECGPKPPGTYRIVVVGSSLAMGDTVQWEKTLTALLPEELSRETGRKVQLYDRGLIGKYPHIVPRDFDGTLADNPDMILWILGPFDIEAETPDFYLSISPKAVGVQARVTDAVRYVWNHALGQQGATATPTMLKHFLYKSSSQYVKACLFGEHAETLRAHPRAEWQAHLRMFESDDAEIERQARAASVPLVAVLVPGRPQAALLSMGEWPNDYNPFKLDNDLRNIITGHGGIYVDIFPAFRHIPNAEQYYLPVDGHPDANGHAIISKLLAKELTGGAVPALKAEARSQDTQEQGK
jgi:hypothetical protein